MAKRCLVLHKMHYVNPQITELSPISFLIKSVTCTVPLINLSFLVVIKLVTQFLEIAMVDMHQSKQSKVRFS